MEYGLVMAKSASKKTPKKKPPSKSAESTAIPRVPSRVKGKLRYEALLEATETLLNSEDPDTIGLYQIADKAKVPPASVYHFFPTKEAAFLGLAQYYADRIAEHLSEPIEAAAIRSWQELAAIDMRRSAEFHNAHPPMMKINYGGYGGVATRNVDAVFARRIASALYSRMNKLFHMPFIRNPDDVFEMRVAIIDAIFAISYRRFGKINEQYVQEAHRAVVAFMSQFLPPRMELRESLIEAAVRGEFVHAPLEIEPELENSH
jgi:AcrR family transcriptional regulator